MKRICVSLLVGIASQVAAGCPYDLRGTWKSDREMSMAFATANAKLEPRTEDFLSALYGHMTLTFSRNEVHLVMPNIEVPVSGERKPFVGFEEHSRYRVMFCNSTTVVWSGKSSVDKEPKATLLKFVDSDTFWVYTGGGDPPVPDLHTREYFRRLK